MWYVLLAIYAVGVAVWGFFRFRNLDSKLRENKRKTHPGEVSDKDEPVWHPGEDDDPGWKKLIK